MRGWNGFGTESQKLFFAGVIRRATQAFAGLRGWHRPRERALARGVNKKHFSGTAEAGALPKSSRAFVGRSARPGRVRDPSLHNHQRPVPTQPLETVPTRASSRARRTSLRGQECCYVRKQGGTLRDFQGGVHWLHPKFRFHPKRVRCPES